MPDALDVRAKTIIDRLIDLADADQAAQLDRECAGDAELRRRVESLLASMRKDDDFLREPTLNPAPPLVQNVGDRAGGRIGPYQLLELIGEGGFGTVFMAEQSEPIRRRVALKIIKLGMDTRQTLARFEAERQALALMDHPNIAKVLEAGATESGRPYFVMELVRGEPVTHYCDRARLSLPERLKLFLDICSAVQHAHQKGIIHRDLKPSNVLVTVADAIPLAKVIDFGIAKATAAPLTDKTLFTGFQQLLGTPNYMSPEQAEPSSADIDTRSDIYSLGVLLYELLAGMTPFDARELVASGYNGMLRILRDKEPPRPSLRFQTLAASSADIRLRTPMDPAVPSQGSSAIEVARRRRLEPMPLTRALRGELDWIVMKSLEKQRSRRYQTASALADDVSRYLANEPVTACPPSVNYRLRKFVRRNRGAVIGGAVVALTLFIAAAVSLASGLSEARQRRAAEVARERAQKAEHEAKARADELDQVARFQELQLSGIDVQAMGVRLRAGLIEKARATAERSQLPEEAVNARIGELVNLIAGSDFTGMALAALDDNVFQRALSAVEDQFTDQPLVKARLLQTSASTMRELGLIESAFGPQKQALEIRLRELGDMHPDTLTSIGSMGLLFRAQGKLAEAESYYREALDRRRRVLGDDHTDTLSSFNNMGGLLQAQGKLADAEVYYRAAMEKRSSLLGEEHRDTLTSLAAMGYLLMAQGKLEEAEPYYLDVLDKRRRVLGDEHPHTLFSINNMAALLQTQGRFSDAEVLYMEALEKRRRVLGDEHPDTLQTINNLGNLLEAQGRHAEAEPYYREALEKRRRLLGDEHPHTLNSISNMSTLLQAEGRLSEAEPYTREALEKRRRILGNDHPDTLVSINNMGMLMMKQGKHAEAEAYLREVLEGIRRVLGDEHPNAFFSIMNLGLLLQEQGRYAEAVALLATGEPLARKRGTGDHAHRLGRFLATLGRAHTAAGDYNAAQVNLSESYAIVNASKGVTEWDRTLVLSGLVELFDAWHAAEPDKGYDAQAAEWRAKLADWQGEAATGRPTTPTATTSP